MPKPVERVPFLEGIHRAQFNPPPSGFKKLDRADIQLAREAPEKCPWLPRQEKGQRPSCALPYELEVDGALDAHRKSFAISFAAGRAIFGERAAGAPFHVYSPGPMRPRFYAVAPGDRIEDAWPLADFPDGAYHLCVHGPNGFFREFRGTADDPALEISLVPVRRDGTLTGDVLLKLANRDATRTFTAHIEDMAYGAERRTVLLGAEKSETGRAEIAIELRGSHGWHDLRIRTEETPRFEKRYAGRIETGRESMTDPAIGRA